MKKRGQGGEAIKYLIISSMIIVISLFGYSVFDKIRDKTCNSELAKFEIDLRDLDKQVKFGSAEEFQRVVPCNADKIYFVDLDSDIDMELLDDEPLLRDSISSKAQKNVFLMKKGKILDSFYAGNLGLSYPNFMCLVPRTGKIDFFLEGKGRSVDMYAGCFQPECTFLPQKVTDEEAAAIVREANEFGCANCPNRGIYDEWAKYYDVKLNFDISRKYKYCSETGQTTVEILIKPKGGADFENFHFYESIPKECIENINDYLVDEIDADIKPDPLIAWNLGGIKKEQRISYILDTIISDKCKEIIKGIGTGKLESGQKTIASEIPLTDEIADDGENQRPEISIRDEVVLPALGKNVLVENLELIANDEVVRDLFFSVTSQSNPEKVDCGVEIDSSNNNKKLVCNVLYKPLFEEGEQGSNIILMATDPEGLFRETPIKVLVQPYPEEKSECGDGIIELEEECDDGNFLNRDGCSAVCTLETCDVVDNGNICTGNEFCDGELISTLDSDTCCVGTCSLVAGTQCTSCGEGIFNVCDSEECSSIQEGCYFYDGFGTNTCSTCKNLKCEDYPNEDSCTSNECRQEVCGWSDDENKCEVSTFCGDGTCNEGKETCGTCAEDCGACAIASDFKTATCEKKISSGCKLNPSCGSGQTIKNLGSCSLTGIGKAFGIGWGTQYECYSQYQTSSCIKDPKCDSGDVLTQYNPCTPECSDGTTLAQCSTTKPKYCNDNINLVDNCGLCGGCLDDEVCNEISGSCELKTAELAASYTSTTKSGNNYYFNMVIKNLNDVGINFDRVDRKFLTTGYSWTSDKNWIIGKCGSVRLNGESECIKEGRYFTTPTSDTYRETWVGTDDNGNSISVSYVISTSEFS